MTLGHRARLFAMSPSSPHNTPADASARSEAPKARRFAPEPIETTSKSSRARKHSPEKVETPKVRRFAPAPIEITTKSSRDQAIEFEDKSKPATHRFAPQPIETTTKSSRDKKETALNDVVKPAPRRLAPQPMETTQKSSRDGVSHIKFKPQLVETTYGGNRRSSSRRTSQDSNASTVSSEDRTPRKFTPTVLSTARRSRRAGDSNAANYQDYKTEEGHVIHAREHQRHAGWKTSQAQPSVTGERSHGFSHTDLEAHPEIRRHLAPMDGRPPERPYTLLKPDRKHSFRCPDLDTIESSGSERESGPSSMSCSPGQGSPITASDSSFTEFYKHATRIRESVDENFSQYFLKLEAKKAEKRMQEQALAAFPNSDFHEPVQHYVNSEQDDSSDVEIEDRPVTWEGFDEEEFMHRAAIRRESTGKINFEQLEMQRHAEQVEQERNANKTTEKRNNEPKSPWWKPDAAPSTPQQDNEMRSMRDRARPPMLGCDLVFPRCPSPEPARFDVTQSCATLRKQMCNQSGTDTQKTASGLWGVPAPESDKSVSSAAAQSPAKSGAAKGLWGGFCVSNNDNATPGLAPPSIPTGLMTPAPRGDNVNPFEQSFAGRAGSVTVAPPTPPESVDMNRLDTMLMNEQKLEEDIEKEFPDSFITQVYNYLSLGYPSLARRFDEELSKISSVPIKELREDDVKAKQTPRGYIRLGPDFEGGGGVGLTAVECKRWQALKLYIREWARQEKKVDAPGGGWQLDAPAGNWATTQRKGSWAI